MKRNYVSGGKNGASMNSQNAKEGAAAVRKKRLAFPVKIGEYVTLRTDLLLRSAYWIGKPEERPLSRWAGSEGRVVSLNIADEEVNIKGIGWTPLGDLLDPQEISWEEDEYDPILDDDLDVVNGEDDEVFDDDDDDIIFEED